MIVFMRRYLWIVLFFAGAFASSAAEAPAADVLGADTPAPAAESSVAEAPSLEKSGGDKELRSFDIAGVGADGRQFLRISSDVDIPNLRYSLSNRVDDVDCAHYQSTASFPVTGGETIRRMLNFSRQGAPTRALYEWHICFGVGDVTYRAWRGFDPGPGTDLAISCVVDQARIDRADRAKYLCTTDKVTQNPDNHAEYAFHCWGADSCKRFETRAALEAWTGLNPLSREALLEIAGAVLTHQFSDAAEAAEAAERPENSANGNPSDYYISVGGEDPPRAWLKKFSTDHLTFHPASAFKAGGREATMQMWIRTFEQTDDGVAQGGFETYCGPLCASAHKVIVEKSDDAWKVKSVELEWVS